jgi:hypothetical protein
MKTEWFDIDRPNNTVLATVRIEGKKEYRLGTFRNVHVMRVCINALMDLSMSQPDVFMEYVTWKPKKRRKGINGVKIGI